MTAPLGFPAKLSPTRASRGCRGTWASSRIGIPDQVNSFALLVLTPAPPAKVLPGSEFTRAARDRLRDQL